MDRTKKYERVFTQRNDKYLTTSWLPVRQLHRTMTNFFSCGFQKNVFSYPFRQVANFMSLRIIQFTITNSFYWWFFREFRCVHVLILLKAAKNSPGSHSDDNCWHSVHNFGLVVVDVENVQSMVGSSCRLSNLNLRFRQVESTMVNLSWDRSHLVSNCSQELLQNLPMSLHCCYCCCLLMSALWLRLLLLLLLNCCLAVPSYYPF